MELLIVEDEPVIGKALRQGFREAGHECVWAKDGDKGWELACSQQFDAIMLVPRKMLCEHLWESDWEGATNVIEVHINRLRGKLDKGFDRSLIQTIRGRGYALRAS